MKRLVVIGGGISGLAAAYTAATHAEAQTTELEVVVLEAGTEVGGKVLSAPTDDWLVERGPTGYLDNEPRFDELVRAVGMGEAKLPARDAAAHRYLVRGGELREIQTHPLRFLRSGILSPSAVLRMLREPWIPRKPDDADESVWEFAHRRLGSQVADRMIAPMVLGVFAGDAKELSLPAAFPRMAELERDHGSLIRAMFALKREKRKSGRESGGPAGPAGKLTSFPEGLQALPRALAADPRIHVRLGARVAAVHGPSADPHYHVQINGDAEVLPADAVVFATEAWAAAELLGEACPEAARLLAGIPYPPVAVVALGFGPEELPRVPVGFGVLIPRSEGYRALGCLWDTHLFAGRSPEGHLLLRVLLGGAVDPAIGELDEDALLELTRTELRRLFGIQSAPIFQDVTMWPRAIPQYELGHLAKAAAIEKELAAVPGIFLAGNALHGIAFAKSALQGIRQGEAAAAFLA